MRTPYFLLLATPILAADALTDTSQFPTTIPGISSFYSAFYLFVGTNPETVAPEQLTTQPFFTEWVAEVKKHTQTSWYAEYLDALTGLNQITDLDSAQLNSLASDLFTETELDSLASALSALTDDGEPSETTGSDWELVETTDSAIAEDSASESSSEKSSSSHSSSGSSSGSSSRSGSTSGSSSHSGSSSAAASGSSSSKANGVSYVAPAGAVLGALAVALL
jgi:uncharacterized membrane protein YgcG